MSAWGKSWGLTWAAAWGPVETDPNAMAGIAGLVFTATGTLTNGAEPDFIVGAAGFTISATGTLTDANAPDIGPLLGGFVRPRINRTRENDEAFLLLIGAM
jgi:hypothetical protein